MSTKTGTWVGYEFSVAEDIFTDEAMEKYYDNDPYFVELFNMINEVFPEKKTNLCVYCPGGKHL